MKMSEDEYTMEITDAHVHLWNPDKLCYPWLKELPTLNRAYLPGDYDWASTGHKTGKILFVQCEALPEQAEEEIRWISELAEKEKRIAGAVAFAPLEKGKDASREIEALLKYPLLKGVRRIIQYEEDLEFCLKPEFIEGVKLLSGYDLSFDICVSHRQLKNAAELVKRCPDVRFVLDHIGKPDIKNERFEPWASELEELSGMPNVFCKISGVTTEADHERWKVDDIRKYIEHAAMCFGFDRIIFGGDWPVVNLAGGYRGWLDALKNIFSGCSKTEMEKLLHENAKKAYHLPGTK